MTELRLRELDNFLNSPIGKVYTAVVGMVFFYGGSKFIVKGIVDLGNGLAMAYGMDAATGQMIPMLVRSDGLVISEVIQSVSAGVAQAITGIGISAFSLNGNLQAGNQTQGGRTLTDHAAENANKRGFSLDKIDDIIENYSQKVYQSEGKTVFAKKNGNWYDVIITNNQGDIITVVGGKSHSLKTWKDVVRMLNNNGGFSSLPY